ncbi:pyridoxamine 5'-phosphate oxidase [Bacillus pakistanensis]|uniref:Pyridoxamine 5'-phosphate oxidase n=1 Tax=Rossellomorea pakistanensis TaxID=992288 RepID=A0ABS2N9M6_9BACI|nr:pyridoxal 5'-phosphate synthase [Bacillus pakistanensis]MBM7584464.1 pyridoxamine 5'-phosphate oxidase [Bacillus pakistanensis]
MKKIRKTLRNLPSLEGPLPEFNTKETPNNPVDLFIDWLTFAIKNEIKEPHSMTLSTVDVEGQPDARVLILKNVDDYGWYFASSSNSQKGSQLEHNSKAALTFYWSDVGRQIRIKGNVIRMGEAESKQDFLLRSEGARAASLVGNQSKPLKDSDEFDLAYKEQRKRLNLDSDPVSPYWTLYRLEAMQVEFWQGHPERNHTRLLYRLQQNSWQKSLLWP